MDLLEEAKLRYPRGSKIIGINTKDIKQNINCGKEITLDGTFYLQKKNEHVYRSSDAIYASPNVYVYSQETWAKIIEYKIPDKWCVKVNSSYNDYFELHNWRKDIWKNSGYIDSDKVWMPTKRDSYTEIRIEDFIKYIYKEEEKEEEGLITTNYCEYWKFTGDVKGAGGFTYNKIYKTFYPDNINQSSAFKNDKGLNNGWANINTQKFIPSTYEEYCVQENINVTPVKKEEESLIGRYAKIILKGDINEGKYYLITSKNYATRLFDNVENCSFSNNFNWEIMPKDFVYTGQDNVPQYVKCVKSWHSVWTTDKVYKTEKEQLDFPNTLRVKDDTGEVIKVYSWDAPTTFKISTEEEYLAQQTLVKQTIPEYWAVKYTESNFDTLEHWRLSQKDVDKIYNVSVGIYLVSKHHDDSYLFYCSDIKNQSKYKEITFEDFKKHFSIKEVKKEEIMEDLTGRWLKALTDYPQCTIQKKGEYIKVIGKYPGFGSYEVELSDNYGADPSKKELWELMPIGFSPNTKEECSKEYMPKYVEWINNLGSGRCGKMCGDQFLEKGKIFDTNNDSILPQNCEFNWKRLWKYYYYNFTESTEKEYDAQNNIIRVKMSDTSSTDIKGTNPWLIDEVGQYDGFYYTTNLWSNTTGEKKLGRGYAVDVYEKKDKSIKQIELPKPKKRLVF